MKKLGILLGIFLAISVNHYVSAHCQMPCGVYHDEMVFDQIDQYVETMFKGCTVLNDNKFSTVKDKNEFVRWVMTKEKSSNDISELITSYFLQQKVQPDQPDTAKQLISAHKLLFLIVKIKQGVDTKVVGDFADEWEKFKLMFHVEGYECQVDMLRLRKRQQELNEKNQDHSHDHDHDHPHDHTHEN